MVAPRAPRRPVRLAALALAVAVGGGACAAPGRPAPAPHGRGSVHVVSVPSGARIVIDGRPTPYRTPTTVTGVESGTRRLLVTLAGHRNWSGSVKVERGATAEVAVALAPAAAGSLAVTSVPAGAEVLVDGAARGITPLLVEPVPVGTSTVQVLHDGYEPWSQAVVVLPDRRLAVDAALAPAHGTLGHLAVRSRPPGARIVLDGFPTGRVTPVTLYGLQAGRRRVEVRLPGHRNWCGTVAVREGATEDLLVTLRPVPGRSVGSARVESEPPGAAIRLDGVLLQARTPADLEDLAPGRFRIEISRPGSRAWLGELRIEPDAQTTLAVTLLPEGPWGGALRAESEPPGASIFVDGAPTGLATPALIPRLPTGDHRLEISLPGHRAWTGCVQVTRGATASVRARLSPLPEKGIGAPADGRDPVRDPEGDD